MAPSERVDYIDFSKRNLASHMKASRGYRIE